MKLFELNKNLAELSNISNQVKELRDRAFEVAAAIQEDGSYIAWCFDNVCSVMKVSISDITSQSRKQNIVFARVMLTHFLIKSMTLADVGKVIGNRDHSTIVHYKKVHNDMMYTSEWYREMHSKVEQLIYNKPAEK